MHIRLRGEKPSHWLVITCSIYLNPLGLLKQNTPDWVTFKTETLVTVLRGKPSRCLLRAWFLLCWWSFWLVLNIAEGVNELFEALFLKKAISPFTRVPYDPITS